MREIEIRISGNGYTMRARDPEIEAANAKGKGEWRDPNVEVVFTTEAELMAGLGKALKSLKAIKSEYETAFAKAITEGIEG